MSTRIENLLQSIDRLKELLYIPFVEQTTQAPFKAWVSSFRCSPEDLQMLRNTQNDPFFNNNEEELVHYTMMLRFSFFQQVMGTLLENGVDHRVILENINNILYGNKNSDDEPFQKLLFLTEKGLSFSKKIATKLLFSVMLSNMPSSPIDRLVLVQYLVVRMGANVNYVQNDNSVLANALVHKKDDFELIQFLIKKGANVDHPSINLKSLLVHYIRSNDRSKQIYANVLALVLGHSKNPRKLLERVKVGQILNQAIRKGVQEKLEDLQNAIGLREIHEKRYQGTTQEKQNLQTAYSTMLQRIKRKPQERARWKWWQKFFTSSHKNKKKPQDVIQGLRGMKQDTHRELLQMLGVMHQSQNKKSPTTRQY